MFIARNLEKLPEIADAFDTGEVGWTKVREILKVATPETQGEWLGKAKKLKSRELERLVKKEATSEAFATLRISLPEGVMNLWLECEEIAERHAECELEPWQVLEQMMAEYLSTYAASSKELLCNRQETEEEKGIPWEVRRQVVERDHGQCQFPDCSMRAQLGLHHIRFRSRGGEHSPENLITLCAAHHTLIHQHICGVDGRAPADLRWKGPFLDRWSSEDDEKNNNKETDASHQTDDIEGRQAVKASELDANVQQDAPGPCGTTEPDVTDDEDWATKEVAAIFDQPNPPRTKRDPLNGLRDGASDWCDKKAREIRKKRRFGKVGQRPLLGLDEGCSREHVFAAETNESFKTHRPKGSRVRFSRGDSVSPEPT